MSEPKREKYRKILEEEKNRFLRERGVKNVQVEERSQE